MIVWRSGGSLCRKTAVAERTREDLAWVGSRFVVRGGLGAGGRRAAGEGGGREGAEGGGGLEGRHLLVEPQEEPLHGAGLEADPARHGPRRALQPLHHPHAVHPRAARGAVRPRLRHFDHLLMPPDSCPDQPLRGIKAVSARASERGVSVERARKPRWRQILAGWQAGSCGTLALGGGRGGCKEGKGGGGGGAPPGNKNPAN
jgi:hypothetical protein